jgi:hypothetical protein
MRLTGLRVARRVVSPAVELAVVLGLVAASHRRGAPASPGARAFRRLRREQQPQGWKIAVTGSGPALAYPRAGREIHTDPGAGSAAPAGGRGIIGGS